jgi:ribosomal subunit interface protein
MYMTLRISGKNINLGDALRDRVKTRLDEALHPIFGTRWSGALTLKKDGHQFHADCVVHIDNASTLHSEAKGVDAYAACDAAIHHIEQNLRRYKQKLKMRAPAKAYSLETLDYTTLEAPPFEAINDTEFTPVIIAETALSMPTLSVGLAVEELDMTGAPFLVFRHAKSLRVNFVYKRKDGHIGWIDPPLAQESNAVLKKAA